MKTLDYFFSCALILFFICGIAAARGEQTAANGFDLTPLPYVLDQNGLPFSARANAKALWGISKRGSGYHAEIPANWNGDLLVFLPGGGEICNPQNGAGCQLKVEDPPIRDHLLEKGIAWLSLSYSDKRMVPKVKMLDVLDVLDSFHAQYPQRKGHVFLFGLSAGGATTQVGVELFPQRFDGAVAGCGGDMSVGFGNFYNISLAAMAVVAPSRPPVADFLKRMQVPVDLPTYMSQIAPQIIGGLGPKFPQDNNSAGNALRAIVRNLSGGERPLFDTGFDKMVVPAISAFMGIQMVVDAGPRSFIDNSNVQYRFESQPDQPLTQMERAFNSTIPRFVCDPAVCNSVALKPDQTDHLGGFYRLTGHLQRPLITLHAVGEMISWLSTGQKYANLVEQSGASKWLVQRAIRDVNHCGFTVDEQSQAFDDLVQWVKQNKRPAGDDIRNAKAVAAPNFGCTFTRGAHADDMQYARVCR
jgi:hypothetical protein